VKLTRGGVIFQMKETERKIRDWRGEVEGNMRSRGSAQVMEQRVRKQVKRGKESQRWNAAGKLSKGASRGGRTSPDKPLTRALGQD